MPLTAFRVFPRPPIFWSSTGKARAPRASSKVPNSPGSLPADAVKIGGYNICLQMPPTAKGFAFITLEDEEGLVNVVLKPNIYRRHRQLVRLKPLLIVDGVVERKDGVINVMAERVSDMQP